MTRLPTTIEVECIEGHTGTLETSGDDLESVIWTRLKLDIRSKSLDHKISRNKIELSWTDTLSIIREFGSKDTQRALNFRFQPIGRAVDRLRRFAEQIRKTQSQRLSLESQISRQQIENRLQRAGFTKRSLKSFQVRDLAHLLQLENGANFSVPGSGKTTVTFALHLLTRTPSLHFFVIAPKAAFQTWMEIVTECMDRDAPNEGAEPFTQLIGSADSIKVALNSGKTRFLISYDLAIRQQPLLATHFASHGSHLVLDESHRMKAGWRSRRGSFLLSVASSTMRRDILTGTPMPQGADDMKSQLDFLWPGHGFGTEIALGRSPRSVLGKLYVRTTKRELDLPKVTRKFIDVDMEPGQLALYSIVRNEFIREYSKQVHRGLSSESIIRARRSVMRLLQLSINPVLAVRSMSDSESSEGSAIIERVLEEGHSNKMLAVMDKVYALARNGEKSVIWTIFTDTIQSFVASLADLNPVFIHGGVHSNSPEDVDSREGRIKRFHEDPNCFVLVANPATAGEGISLHTVCHNAIYADRSYVSTHYLQSIDRVHRLGLLPNQETTIHIFRTKAPPSVGSIDMSVSRRLKTKIQNLQALLDDPDLHELSFDEETALDSITDYEIELQDIMDLVAELKGTATDRRIGDL